MDTYEVTVFHADTMGRWHSIPPLETTDQQTAWEHYQKLQEELSGTNTVITYNITKGK